MTEFLEKIREIINEMNIPEVIDERVRELKIPNNYDVYALEDMLLKLFEDIASEIFYNIDLYRQEIKYGKENLPKLKELVGDYYKKYVIPIQKRNRKIIVRQVPE